MAQDPRLAPAREHRVVGGGFGCAADHLHWFEIPGTTVRGVALHCPECTRPSAADQLTEVVATGRWTLHGLAGLPAALRADLAASGALAGVYRGTVAQVREAAEDCRAQFGVEPPTGVYGPPRPFPFEQVRTAGVLDAAGEWAAGLGARPA